jgi:hypothetical protein
MAKLNEKIVYIHNPLPDLQDKEIIEKADIEIEASIRPPFDIHWNYAFGNDLEVVRLSVGEYMPLRQSEAAMFLRQFKEIGMVIVEDINDADELKKKTLEGLQTAQKFYADRGNKRLIELRKTHGLGKDEMEDYKYEHWVYYYNQAKADLIGDHIRSVRSGSVEPDTGGPA